jgi:uncharacterized phage protein (TIGR02220 family)
MAERRMFAKTIIDSDAFLDMPATTQLLYFHLSMRADDDGFINKPKAIMRNCRCNEDDMKLLIAKKFIIPFESGVVVVKHWKIHNYIAKDRYTETKYKEEKATLMLDENKAYTQCIQDVDTLETQDRLGKDRLGKDSIDNNNDDSLPNRERIATIVDYLNEKAGTNYRANTKNTVKHINARLTEGYTLEDFKAVIDKKCYEWKGTEMEQYLCPDTLFGTKFEKYLNAKVITKRQNQTQQQGTGNIFVDMLIERGAYEREDF